jgi:hypothetical protein
MHTNILIENSNIKVAPDLIFFEAGAIKIIKNSFYVSVLFILLHA